MPYKTIDLSVSDGLAHFVLNKPDTGNPFDADFCTDMSAAANELAGMEGLRAVMITARGKFFSVGGDIRMFANNLDGLPSRIREWTCGLHMGVARLQRLDVPLIAAVHSACMGGGVGLVAGCDMVLAGEGARFGAAYPQIGYSVDAGSSFTVASRIGIARARRFYLFNEMLDATTAAGIGLVDQVTADSALTAEAEKVARQLAAGPTRAYGEIRRLVNKAFRQPLEAQLEDEAQALAEVAGSADAREGITAFVEKRKPSFTGT